MSAVISEEPGEDAVVWVAAAGDPMVEALRWAAEHERATVFIDPDVRYRGRHFDHFPDPHAIHDLGPEAYVEIIRRMAADQPRDDGDELRERGMAHHLQQAAATTEGEILALVGAAHATRVAALLERTHRAAAGSPTPDIGAAPQPPPRRSQRGAA